jgi:hypothetical protein
MNANLELGGSYAIDLLLRYSRLHSSDKRAIKRKMSNAVVAKLRTIEVITRDVDTVQLRRVNNQLTQSPVVSEGGADSVRIYWNRVLHVINEKPSSAGGPPKLLKAYINSQLN